MSQDTAVPSGSRPYHPLREAPFRWYFFGGLASNIGTWIQNVAAGILMMRLTGSPQWVGYLSAATFAPLFVFGMLGGVLSDRLDRRHIVYAANGTSAVVSVVLAIITANGGLTPTVLLVTALLLGTSYAIVKPTWSAILPLIVPRSRLTSATAFNVLQYNLGRVFGASIATAVLLLAGPVVAFALNAVTFVGPVIAASKLAIGKTAQAVENAEGAIATFVEGLRFVLRTGIMRVFIVLLFLVNVMSEVVSTLAPAVASDALMIDESYAGSIVTASALGMTGALLLHERVFSDWSTRRSLAIGFALQAVGAVAISVAPTLIIAIAASMPIGVGTALIVPRLSAGMQERSPDEYLGRVSSAFAVTHLGLRPFAGLLGGFLAEVLGVGLALQILAAVPIVGFAIAVSRRMKKVMVAAPPVVE